MIGFKVISRFARHLQDLASPDDLVDRMGAKELVLFMASSDGRNMLERVERLRVGLSALYPDVDPETPVTASFEVVRFEPDESFRQAYERPLRCSIRLEGCEQNEHRGGSRRGSVKLSFQPVTQIPLAGEPDIRGDHGRSIGAVLVCRSQSQAITSKLADGHTRHAIAVDVTVPANRQVDVVASSAAAECGGATGRTDIISAISGAPRD